MMGLEPWWLDAWVFMGTMMSIFAAFFAVLGFVAIVIEGRQAWTQDWTFIICMMFLVGWLLPLVLVGLVVTGIYRIVSGK